MKWTGRILFLLLMAMGGLSAAEEVGAENSQSLFERAAGQYKKGNYKDALTLYEKALLSDEVYISNSISKTSSCLDRLRKQNEFDALAKKVIEKRTRPQDWECIRQLAQQVSSGIAHHGMMIDNKFRRGGGARGKWVSSSQRDRVWALQLMLKAQKLMGENGSGADEKSKASFWLRFSSLWSSNGAESWRMQILTDLTKLPDYEEQSRYYHRQAMGAPVDAQGKPVFYEVPKSFDEAKNDGERWRWCLAQADRYSPSDHYSMWNVAEFSNRQFGVQTLRYLGTSIFDEMKDRQDSIFNLSTLKDNQSIARLASGVSRVTLPGDYAYLEVFKKLSEINTEDKHQRYRAQKALARGYENRRQYVKALSWWKQAAESAPSDYDKRTAEKAVKQITGAWARFEPGKPQPAGVKPDVYLRFRNGKKIHFTARKIKYRELIHDTIQFIKDKKNDNSGNQYWQRNINNIGRRLLEKGQKKYVGEVALEWEMDLAKYLPQKKYEDARVKVTFPDKLAGGGYLLEGKMEDGNSSMIVVWLSDTLIVLKALKDNDKLFYFADDTTGHPVAGMKADYFAYATTWVNKDLKHQYGQKELSRTSDVDGLLRITKAEGSVKVHDSTHDYPQYILTATKQEGDRERFACIGLNNVWYYGSEATYDTDKIMFITDRPVYRPGDTVHVKGWARKSSYTLGDKSVYAGKTFTIGIRDGRNTKTFDKKVTADPYGGFEFEYVIPMGNPLGRWSVFKIGGGRPYGSGTFRVEEYKKPEFEVMVDAPTEPITLGETFTATIKAKYYYGQPVKKAKVKYKVYRNTYSSDWFPPMVWDWLYGSGYWWFADNYLWYPGWAKWGCFRPQFAWWGWGGRSVPQELVTEQETEIGSDGTVKVVVDTTMAKELHPDLDHKYEIKVEVTDESRRTIDGSGTVLAARKPFSVTAWVNRGYYTPGEEVRASFAARTLDGKPVAGKGTVKLNHVTYKEGKPVEKTVNEWAADFGKDGRAEKNFVPPQQGQYRLACTVTDKAGHAIEGGYIFTVIGEAGEVADSQFNPLEIIPQKMEYKPGETCRLQINSRVPGASVLLTVRCGNGKDMPKVLRRDARSGLYEFKIEQADMPNIFVEGICAAQGEVTTVVRQIAIPPEKRILSMEVLPGAEKYKPAQKAKVKIRLKDLQGKPFSGQAVVTVYDKSVEYISGGSNVPDIKKYFWDWKRHYNANIADNLMRYLPNLVKPGEEAMRSLGVFGNVVIPGLKVSGDFSDHLELDDKEAYQFSGQVLSEAMDVEVRAQVRPASSESGLSKGRATIKIGGEFKLRHAIAWSANNAEAADKPVTVRSNFSDTAYWTAAIETDQNGEAEIEVPLPDSLTTWKIKVWAMGQGTKVAQAGCEIITSKDLIIRLQSPRFFTEGDTAVISGNIHNYLDKPQTVKVSITLGGNSLNLDKEYPEFRSYEIPAGEEKRVGWLVRAVREGKSEITLKAIGQDDSDAMRLNFPVQVHGMKKLIPACGVLREDKSSATVTLDVPQKRRIDETRLEVRYSPTLALAMVDALPYLCEYPYGCTEQTLNKFLPLVVTQKAIKKLGVNLSDVKNKLTNLNAQELGDTKERAKQWKKDKDKTLTFDPYKDGMVTYAPVFDEAKVKDMVEYGIKRLTAMQCSDGGWGWFGGTGEYSWPHTTCVVVRGLLLARSNGVIIPGNVIDRGVRWLERYQKKQLALLKEKDRKKPYKTHADNLDALVYATLADAKVFDAQMRDFLYRDRTMLSVYSNALFAWGLYLNKDKDGEQLKMLLDNLSQYVVRDAENQTAYFNLGNNNWWWYWYGSEVEAMAVYLKLLAHVDAKNPVASEMVKYLLNNRKHATYWNSTRDTSMCIEAFAAYLDKSGETEPDMTVEVLVDGVVKKTVKVNKENLFTFDNRLVLTGKDIASGKHKVELRRKGKGPLYFNTYLSYFSLEDFITAAGLEIKTARRVYKLVEDNRKETVAGSRGQLATQMEEHYKRVPLKSGDAVKSGDLLEIELIIDSKNDYEYLLFEDMKAAGTEPVSVRSGYNGNAIGAYVEYRDNRVCFFVQRLRRGTSSVTYRVRAVYPGSYSALPAVGQAMYAPELRGNSNEFKLQIDD